MKWIVVTWFLVVLFTSIASIETLAIEAIALSFAAGLAKIDPVLLLRRWIGTALTVIFIAVFFALNHPLRRETGLAALIAGIVLKNGIIVATMISLVESVGQNRILATLGRMGMPAEIISTINMMVRYGPVLTDHSRRMQRARQSRMIHRSLPGIWLVRSGGLSTLLSSSLKRSERIHAAMLSRGWQSQFSKVQSTESGDTGIEGPQFTELDNLEKSEAKPNTK